MKIRRNSLSFKLYAFSWNYTRNTRGKHELPDPQGICDLFKFYFLLPKALFTTFLMYIGGIICLLINTLVCGISHPTGWSPRKIYYVRDWKENRFRGLGLWIPLLIAIVYYIAGYNELYGWHTHDATWLHNLLAFLLFFGSGVALTFGLIRLIGYLSEGAVKVWSSEPMMAVRGRLCPPLEIVD